MRVRGWKRDGGARGGWDRCARGTRGGEGGGVEYVGRRDGGARGRILGGKRARGGGGRRTTRVLTERGLVFFCGE